MQPGFWLSSTLHVHEVRFALVVPTHLPQRTYANETSLCFPPRASSPSSPTIRHMCPWATVWPLILTSLNDIDDDIILYCVFVCLSAKLIKSCLTPGRTHNHTSFTQRWWQSILAWQPSNHCIAWRTFAPLRIIFNCQSSCSTPSWCNCVYVCTGK